MAAPILPADHAWIARHLGAASAPRAGAAFEPYLPWATFGLLIAAAAMPRTIDGLIAVTLVGLATWRVADSTGRPARVGPVPANDNPPRPRLPPHALRW